MAKRKMPTDSSRARFGQFHVAEEGKNYDASDFDEGMHEALSVAPAKMNKTESGYLKSRKNSPSAIEAIRKTRKANKGKKI